MITLHENYQVDPGTACIQARDPLSALCDGEAMVLPQYGQLRLLQLRYALCWTK